MAPSDPLDELARVKRELLDVDDWEESTARTDVHVHLDSKPDSDPPSGPPKSVWGILRWALVALGAGLATGLVAALQHCR